SDAAATQTRAQSSAVVVDPDADQPRSSPLPQAPRRSASQAAHATRSSSPLSAIFRTRRITRTAPATRPASPLQIAGLRPERRPAGFPDRPPGLLTAQERAAKEPSYSLRAVPGPVGSEAPTYSIGTLTDADRSIMSQTFVTTW